MWGLIWYPSRLLDEAGLSVVWMTLTIYLLPALLLGGALTLRGQFKSLMSRDLIGLSVAAGVTNLAFLVALIEGEVMRVMLLFYLSPLWTLVLARWWLNEHVSIQAVRLIMLAMLGMVLMLWNTDIGFPWPQGVADGLAILAGLAFASHNVLSRRLANTPMLIKNTAVFGGVVVLALGVLLVLPQPEPSLGYVDWILVAMIGALIVVSMTVAVLYGLANMPAFRAAVLMLFELVIAALSAWWLTDERLSSLEWLGGSLILLAGYLLVRHSEAKSA
jgi:drug/metabolite transporter (DMT)-like permease